VLKDGWPRLKKPAFDANLPMSEPVTSGGVAEIGFRPRWRLSRSRRHDDAVYAKK